MDSRGIRRRIAAFCALAVGLSGGFVVSGTPAQAFGPADHALFWNDVLLRTIRTVGGAPGPIARAGAMMHGAMYDAANAVACLDTTPITGAPDQEPCIGAFYSSLYIPPGDAVPITETAIDHAAYGVLDELYPTLDFSADLAAAQAGAPTGAGQAEGVRYGQAAAAAMVQARATDGSGNTTPYVPGTNPGDWRPTDTRPAATPNWGLVTPFTLTSGAQFRPPLPGGFSRMRDILSSPAYAQQLNEVKQLGSAASATRTADQTEQAWFWANDLDRTYKPPGQLFAHTREVSDDRGLDQRANLRLLALVAFAMADAGIAAWDAKYDTAIDLWRPESAVRLADTDYNAATTKDPSWLPLSANEDGVHFSPPFPAYVSGHATFAGAWAAVMRAYFGTDAVTFTGGTEDPHALGVTRTFTSFSAAATENARSRIYLGVHYQWDADFGLSTGTKVGDQAATRLAPIESWLVESSGHTYTACQDRADQLAASQGKYDYYQCVYRAGSGTYDLLVY